MSYYGLTGGDITKMEAVGQMSYDNVMLWKLIGKEKGEFEERLMKIRSDKN